MKLLHALLYLLIRNTKVSSFLISSKQNSVIHSSSSYFQTQTFLLSPSPFVQQKRVSSSFPLQALAISGGSASNAEADDKIVLNSIAVGGITAAVGFLYGKMLGFSLHTIWTTIPNFILAKTGSLNPAYFITGVCTLGGMVIGILSSRLRGTFTVADFVTAFSSAPIETLPSSSIHLLPLLFLSLLTSAFGFSVGPEGKILISMNVYLTTFYHLCFDCYTCSTYGVCGCSDRIIVCKASIWFIKKKSRDIILRRSSWSLDSIYGVSACFIFSYTRASLIQFHDLIL